jgi:hypothetical protein
MHTHTLHTSGCFQRLQLGYTEDRAETPRKALAHLYL